MQPHQPAAFIHVQRSGVSVTLPAAGGEWTIWDRLSRDALDVTPVTLAAPLPASRRGR